MFSTNFYQKQKQQTKKIEKNSYPVIDDSNMPSSQISPRTLTPNPPTLPHTAKCDDNFEDELPSFIEVYVVVWFIYDAYSCL